MRTGSLLVGVGLALGLFLAGCAADSDPTPEAPAPVTEGPSTTKKPATDGETTTEPTTTPTEPTTPASVVAWYTDGLTTGTGSANDLAALKVDSSSVTVAQLARLMETNKYNGEPRAKDKPADFDEVFLSRAENGAFMTKLGKAVAKVVADGYPQVIVYSNGPRCIAQAPKGSWLGIAKAGAMIGLESYTTTLTADINAAAKEHPFQDVADLEASQAANAELFAAWEARVRTYITDTKAQLGNDETLNDHITLLQYEDMKHDIEALQKGGMSKSKAEHFASLWYAAMKSAAAKEGVHWGIWHPA
jgi:hypothetical protein